MLVSEELKEEGINNRKRGEKERGHEEVGKKDLRGERGGGEG
jgi:hypothetical protein